MIKIRNICYFVLKFIVMMALMLLMGFILPRLMPGNPFTGAGDYALPQETFASFAEYYAPGQSLWLQFKLYLQHLARLDLGYSFYYKLPVFQLVTGRIGWTLFISLAALAWAAFIAVPAGMFSALTSRRERDRMAVAACVIVNSIPIFLIALFIQLAVAYGLNWLPAQGAYAPGTTLFSREFYPDVLRHGALPVLSVVIFLFPSIFLLTRNIVTRIKKEKYVSLARYLNLRDSTVNIIYILKNSLPEIVGKMNIHFVYAVSGTLFAEIIFSYPGLGMLTRTAVESRDYPLIQGIFFFIGLYGVSVNLFFEWIQSRLNPWRTP